MAQKRELTNAERRKAGCGFALLLGLSMLALLDSLSGAMCETTTYAEATSPSGLTVARVQMTDCGALSGFSRVVWVEPRWLPSDIGLGCRAVAFDGQVPVSLAWRGGDLVVTSAATRDSVIGSENACYGSKVRLLLPPS